MELQLPPAVRIASVTGPRSAVVHFTAAVEHQLAASGLKLRTAGPAPVVLTGPAAAAKRTDDPVQVRLDGVDVL
jgi:primosomal protein N' (replication factor Y)